MCLVNRTPEGKLAFVGKSLDQPDPLYNKVLSVFKKRYEGVDYDLMVQTDPFLRNLYDRGILVDVTPEEIALGYWAKISEKYINVRHRPNRVYLVQKYPNNQVGLVEQNGELVIPSVPIKFERNETPAEAIMRYAHENKLPIRRIDKLIKTDITSGLGRDYYYEVAFEEDLPNTGNALDFGLVINTPFTKSVNVTDAVELHDGFFVSKEVADKIENIRANKNKIALHESEEYYYDLQSPDVKYMRTTRYTKGQVAIDPKYAGSSYIGTGIDKVVRDALSRKVPLDKMSYKDYKDVTKLNQHVNEVQTHTVLTEEAFNSLIADLTRFLANNPNLHFITDNLLTYRNIEGIPGYAGVAGEMDILAVDRDGKFLIIDTKSFRSENTYNLNIKFDYPQQLSAYADALEATNNTKISGLQILAFNVSYKDNTFTATSSSYYGLTDLVRQTVKPKVPLQKAATVKVKAYRTAGTFSSKVEYAQRGSGQYFALDKPFQDSPEAGTVSEVEVSYNPARTLDATTEKGQEEFLKLKKAAIQGRTFESIKESNDAVTEAMISSGYDSLIGFIDENNKSAGRELVIYTLQKPAARPPVAPTAPIATGFQGYKDGFEDKGKGTSEGDGKDKAMREIADGFIGEVSSKRKSSTLTSAETISKKNEGGVPVFNYDSPPYLVLNGLGTNPENAKKVNEKLNAGELTFMLARNGSLENTPLTEQTKSSIKFIASKGNSFVVGDMPGVDSYFIDYLQEIGAKFTIYHTGDTPRIDVEKPKPISQTTPAPTPTPQPTEPIQTISTKENPIVVYVDGSDIKGTGAIGFGVNTTFNNQEYSISGAFETSDLTKFEKDLGITLQNTPSNGVMEFYGSLVALRNTPKEEFVTIKQDLESVQLWILSGLLERLAKQTFTNKDKYSAWYNSLSEETKTDYHNRIQKVVGIDPKIVSKFNWDGRKGYFAEDKTIKVIQQKIIDILLDRKGQVKYEWVKGHSNDPGNDRVDTIAKDRKVYNTYRNLFQQGAAEVSQFPTFNFPLEVGIQKIVEQLNKSEVGYDIFSFKGQQIIAYKESVPEKKHKDSVRFYTINPISTLLYSERYGKPVKIPGYEEFTVFIEQDTGVPFLGSTGQSTTPAHTPLNISEDKMIEAIASEFRKFNIIKALEGAKTIPFFNPENNLKILFQYSDFKREEEEPTTENELGDDIILEDNIILEEDFQKLNQIENIFESNPELDDDIKYLYEMLSNGEKITPNSFPPDHFKTFEKFVNSLNLNIDTEFKTEGKPTILFHGSSSKFGYFKEELLGQNTGAPSAKLAFFTAKDVDTARAYGTQISDPDFNEREPNYFLEELKHIESLPENNPERIAYEKNIENIRQSIVESKDKYFDEEIFDLPDSEIRIRIKTNIYPLFFIAKNPLILDVKGDRKSIGSFNERLIDAKNEGYDAVVFKNVYDGGNNTTDVYTVFSSSQILNIIDVINDKNYNLSLASNRESLFDESSESQRISDLLDDKINDLIAANDINFTNEENKPCSI